jgi:hypothetical protein
MQSEKQTANSGWGAAVAPASALAALQTLVSQNPTPDQFCAELSKIFRVQQTEVALFRLEEGRLKFLFPSELKTAGSIPLSSSSAVAAHTATGRKAEVFNNFARVKHASVFEMVKLAHKEESPDQPPIQRLITAPILDDTESVLGVIQVCRKGLGLLSSGPEFTSDDLRQLECSASLAARAGFMQKSWEPPAK